MPEEQMPNTSPEEETPYVAGSDPGIDAIFAAIREWPEQNGVGARLDAVLPIEIRKMARLTKGELPPDGHLLLELIIAMIEDLAPESTLDFLDVIQLARHQFNISTLNVRKDGIHKLHRRSAVRELTRPGWSQPKPGEIEADELSAGTVAAELRALARRDANAVTTDEGLVELGLEYYDADATLQRHLAKQLAMAGLSPMVVDAEAFRRGLRDHAIMAEFIAAEEARYAQTLQSYLSRRPRKVKGAIEGECRSQ